MQYWPMRIRRDQRIEKGVKLDNGDVKLQMRQLCELLLVKGSLGRLNVGSVNGFDVRTEAQRWLNILRMRNEGSYTG